MAENNNFDVIVIGSGPGGYVAAIRAVQLKLRTAIVERNELGGVCLNWGCIPTKALLSNARIYTHIKEADRWGIKAEKVSFDMKRIIRRSRDVAGTLAGGVAHLMKKNRIEVVRGTARLAAGNEVAVRDDDNGERRLKAKHTIIATGARARTLPGVEVDGKRIITYKEALILDKLPRSIAVIGGGAIGVEFAYFYNAFGAEVTLVEMMDQLLPVEDHEVGRELEKSFQKQGIKVLLETKVQEVERGDKELTLRLEEKGGETRTLQAELALNAVGVVGNTEGLDLETIGVKVEGNRIPVDRWYRTSVEGIYAIGDVIGPPWLAHVASHEGIVCVEKIAGAKTHPVDYRTIPGCTYCYPQVASVGLTERQAREEGYDVRIGKFPFQVLGKARASQATEGFVKLIFDQKYGELLGAHIIGDEATEMIAELVTAKALETTYLELLKTVHAHPTLSEAVMEAAGMAYGEQIHL